MRTVRQPARFQSTLPARGATMPRTDSSVLPYFNPRSLHGERRHQVQGGHDPWHFNPRSLHGERPENKRKRRTAGNFNPRSLHGERPGRLCANRGQLLISIHAPCTGSDPTDANTGFLSRYFNPRSLHGERPTQDAIRRLNGEFQSTLPARGATQGRTQARLIR